MKEKYIPKVGDHVVARRKVKTPYASNSIIGPITDALFYTDRVGLFFITTNKGTPIEGQFIISSQRWNIEFLYREVKGQTKLFTFKDIIASLIAKIEKANYNEDEEERRALTDKLKAEFGVVIVCWDGPDKIVGVVVSNRFGRKWIWL